MRPAVIAGTVLSLCLSAASALGQRNNPPPARPRFAQRQAPRQQFQNQQRPFQNRQMQNQQRPYQGQPQNNGAGRQIPGYGPNAARPGTGQGYNQPVSPGAARPNYNYPDAANKGHLGDWLNQHRNLPIQQQEQLLRNDPNFNRLPPATQQRLTQQLREVNQLPEEQRERRLARSEMLERLSPQDQSQFRQAGRRLSALPPDRQVMVTRAFQDLRSVPLDQRDTVLNSARYQNNLSPDERNILSNLLRAEPYEPPH
jgi:hypothetical protein